MAYILDNVLALSLILTVIGGFVVLIFRMWADGVAARERVALVDLRLEAQRGLGFCLVDINEARDLVDIINTTHNFYARLDEDLMKIFIYEREARSYWPKGPPGAISFMRGK